MIVGGWTALILLNLPCLHCKFKVGIIFQQDNLKLVTVLSENNNTQMNRRPYVWEEIVEMIDDNQ